MARRTVVWFAVAMLLGWRLAQAIPPPWTLEEAKGRADLIVIAKTTQPEAVENVRGANSRIGLEAIEVLKGEIAKEKGKAPKLYLLFFKRPQPRGNIGIRMHVIGGVGHPSPGQGETALIFLRKDPKEGHFRVSCGSFGYVKLAVGTKEGLAAAKKRIARYRQWCERIKDEKLRRSMDAVYQKALAFVEKQGEKAKER